MYMVVNKELLKFKSYRSSDITIAAIETTTNTLSTGLLVNLGVRNYPR